MRTEKLTGTLSRLIFAKWPKNTYERIQITDQYLFAVATCISKYAETHLKSRGTEVDKRCSSVYIIQDKITSIGVLHSQFTAC